MEKEVMRAILLAQVKRDDVIGRAPRAAAAHRDRDELLTGWQLKARRRCLRTCRQRRVPDLLPVSTS